MGLFNSMIPAKSNRPASLIVLDPVEQSKVYVLEYDLPLFVKSLD